MKLSGTVSRVKDYGFFVSFDDSKLSALCHVSEVTADYIKVF
jgi:predicted RNA-binding protein with RPS1 domain